MDRDPHEHSHHDTTIGIRTCASRATVLIDNASYFAAAADAMRKAKRSIWILGWQFDPRTLLEPDRSDQRLGDLLKDLAEQKPRLEIRVLIWNASLLIALAKDGMPQRAAAWFTGSRVRFQLDRSAPFGASRHQKLLVVDDTLGFCSGEDFAPERWDDQRHIEGNPLRSRAGGKPVPPRHGTTLMVEGDIAGLLAEEARLRWREATGVAVAAVPLPERAGSYWPEDIQPGFTDVPVRMTRTSPQTALTGAIRENEALFLALIAEAEKLIYIENQYFTCRKIRDALAARLQEPDGPEIILVIGLTAPSYFDALVMDPVRDVLLRELIAADRFGRFRVFSPTAKDGTPIVAHSKLMIIDDRKLRIGSSNLSQRSFGYDTECDLTIELDETDPRLKDLAALLATLLGHFVGQSAEVTADAIARSGSVCAALESLDPSGRRLTPLKPLPRGPLAGLINRYGIGDPASTGDAWRPWRRRGSKG